MAVQNIALEVGRIIHLLRVADGLSQSELADKLGISRAYLSQVETGHADPGLGLLKKVAKYFDIPLAILLPDEHEENSELFAELQKLLAQVLAAKITAKKT